MTFLKVSRRNNYYFDWFQIQERYQFAYLSKYLV